MSRIDELVDENTKAELVELAEEYGLPHAGKNKPELAAAIAHFEAGVPIDSEAADEEDEPDVAPLNEGDFDVDEVLEANQPEPEPEPSPEADAEGDDDAEILVKFTGQALKFQVGKHFFGRHNPFQVVSEREADVLFSHPRHSNKFRVATPKEAREFYS